MALYGPLDQTHQQYRSCHIQELQRWKDRASEALMILEANVNVITALQKFYTTLKTNPAFSSTLKGAFREDINKFVANLDEINDELRNYALRARLLVGIISDRKELVRLFEPFPTVSLCI